MPLELPDFRALVRRDAINLVDWQPWLATGGPMGHVVRSRGSATTTIVDLTVIWDDDGEDRHAGELVVVPIAGDVARAREALTRWATTVGYRRMWLPDAVVELDAQPGGAASTTCGTCRMHWEDRGETAFWLQVRAQGRFSGVCVICGGKMPQWTVGTPTVQPLEDRRQAPMDVR